MGDLTQTCTIHPARYAKGKMAIHCKPDGTGWKTLAALVISRMPGTRWSNREHAYICSPSRAEKFKAELARIQAQRESVRTASKAIDHINGIITDNRPENLRVVTLKENL